jgi:hypothetical protein
MAQGELTRGVLYVVGRGSKPPNYTLRRLPLLSKWQLAILENCDAGTGSEEIGDETYDVGAGPCVRRIIAYPWSRVRQPELRS